MKFSIHDLGKVTKRWKINRIVHPFHPPSSTIICYLDIILKKLPSELLETGKIFSE